MKRFFSISKMCMVALVCVMFFGIGMNVKAAAPNKVTGLQQMLQPDEYYEPTSIALSWKAPGGDVSKYRVEYCEDGKFTPGKIWGVETPYTSLLLEKFNYGKSYYFRVAAEDNAGNLGEYSDVVEMVTCPAGSPTSLKQTKAEAKAVTFSWKKVSGATTYVVQYGKAGTNPSNFKIKDIGNKTSYKISASANSKYTVNVYAVRKSKGGFLAFNYVYKGQTMKTLPSKVSKVKMLLSGDGARPAAACAYFTWKESSAADGYECIFYGNNKKKLFSKDVKSLGSTPYGYGVKIANSKLKSTQFMKIKVRAYVKVNGKKKPGPWSDDVWFAKTPNVKSDKNVNNGIKLTWSKTAGAKDYTISVSKSKNSGYKKVATTKKNTYRITSFRGSKISPGNTYYIKVVANKKVGKKTFTSDKLRLISVYVYRTYR